MVAHLEEFLDNLGIFIQEIAGLERTVTTAMAEQTVYRLENYLQVLLTVSSGLEYYMNTSTEDVD